MPGSAASSVYRIERRGSGDLALWRGDVLVDVDREINQDSRADIERWGSLVAWAEDHTVIERWDQPDPGEAWRVLVGVPCRYVSWRVEDAAITSWDEVGSDNWITRHIEADAGHRYSAAGSLSEVLAARDTGGAEAVIGYERIYGVVPEAPLPPDAEWDLTPITALEFVQRWITARRELERRAGA